jgi:tripartite-type tricarboxylate transporter receptor subunit TctC
MGIVIALAGAVADAQPFPTRGVRIVSPYPAGISPDVAARVVAEQLAKAWHQQVLLDPRPGANGFIAIGAAKKAAPDGHELLLAGNAHLAINPNLFRTIPYDPVGDFAPISLIYRAPFFIVVSRLGPFKTVKDVIAAAKAHPDKLGYSTPYVGSPPHLGGALLAHLTHTKMLAVHYKDGAQLYTSVANGEVGFSVATVGSVTHLVSAGKLKLLAIAAPARLASEPDVPTAKEVGLPPGYEVDSWVGFVALRGTPPEVVRRISQDVTRALGQPDVKERYRNLGLEPTAATPEELAGIIRTDLKRYAEQVKRIGIQPE